MDSRSLGGIKREKLSADKSQVFQILLLLPFFCGQRLFGSIMKLVVALTVGLVKGVVGLFKKNETEV